MNRRAQYKFLLYIAGDTQNSSRAVANLKTLCESYLPARHEIEIVDVFRDPKRALTDGIFLTPTLVKLGPLPVRKIVGTLSEITTVLQALELETKAV